jgi:hypothetical protein
LFNKLHQITHDLLPVFFIHFKWSGMAKAISNWRANTSEIITWKCQTLYTSVHKY